MGRDSLGGWFNGKHLTQQVFVDKAVDLMVSMNIRHNQADRHALYDIFDSMDYDGNGELSVGEWAGGLSVFFQGDMDQCIHAIFDVLDTNGDKSLSKVELSEYLKPFVNAMTPPEAEPLRPLLTRKCADDIFAEMDFDHDNQISSDEMLHWSKQGNNIIDRLAMSSNMRFILCGSRRRTSHRDLHTRKVVTPSHRTPKGATTTRRRRIKVAMVATAIRVAMAGEKKASVAEEEAMAMVVAAMVEEVEDMATTVAAMAMVATVVALAVAMVATTGRHHQVMDKDLASTAS